MVLGARAGQKQYSTNKPGFKGKLFTVAMLLFYTLQKFYLCNITFCQYTLSIQNPSGRVTRDLEAGPSAILLLLKALLFLLS
jgi:hypothetical protein